MYADDMFEERVCQHKITYNFLRITARKQEEWKLRDIF